MSVVKDNLVTEGLSKKIGGRFCFRQSNGKTILYRVGLRKGPMTEAQLAVQEKFAQASSQARADMLDASKKAEWQAIANSSGKYSSAYGVAMAHYYALLNA